MAQNSNIVTPTMTSTAPNLLQNALTNKISPQPLTPLVGALAPKPYVPQASVAKPVVQPAQQVAQPTSQTPTYTPSTPAYSQPIASQSPSLVNPNFSGVTGVSPVPASSGPTYQGLVGQIADKASKPSDQYTQAYNQYNDINDKLTQSRIAEANALAGNANDPVDLTFQQGRGQVLQNQYLQQQNAYAQQLGATSNLLSSATGQQQAQQSGLISAAGLSQPSLNAYGQTYYSPLLGGAIGGQGVSPSDPFYQTLQTYANLLANNQPGTIPASITGNSVLNAQLQQMAKQINPNYNYNTAQGGAAAQQYGSQAAGSAGVQAAIPVFTQAYNDVSNLGQKAQTVSNLGSSLVENMKQGAINPTSSTFLNSLIKNVRNQLSSSAQAQFDTSYAQLKNNISGLLALGGSETPTELTRDANLIINGDVTVGAMQAVLDRINNTEVPILTKALMDKGNAAWATIQNGGQPQGGQSIGGGSGSISSGGYNFVQDANGNWVAK